MGGPPRPDGLQMPDPEEVTCLELRQGQTQQQAADPGIVGSCRAQARWVAPVRG